MNHCTSTSELPQNIEPTVQDRQLRIDNLFAQMWAALGLNGHLGRAGMTKRSGLSARETVFLLLMWRWLRGSSIAMFCRHSMQEFFQARKDAVYEFFKREDLNWRGLNYRVARAVYQRCGFKRSSQRAFVIDDTIVSRRGKKMEGVSAHYDHCLGKTVIGQQVVTLGLVADDGFLPLDSELFISSKKVQKLNHKHRDGRSVVARRYRCAKRQSKPQMVIGMLKKAMRMGFEAPYLVADSWYGTKRIIQAALELKLTAVLRMKRGNLKYCVLQADGNEVLLDAKELYAKAVRKKWRKVAGLPWRVVSCTVQLNLEEDESKPERWQPVKLLFVRGLDDNDKNPSSKNWALFLSTDLQLSAEQMLQTYSLRWSVEVYFKEAKQHLGFLSEQTRSFASFIASIHLCAIRHLLLSYAALSEHGHNVPEVREQIKEQLDTICFARRLWNYFRSLVYRSIRASKTLTERSLDFVMQAIDREVEQFLERSLQLDVLSLQMEDDPAVLSA